MKQDGSAQGWAPSAYLEDADPKPIPPPAPPPAVRHVPPPPPITNGVSTNGTAARPVARAKPTPPAPPAKRPTTTTGKKPLPPPAPRDSAVSMGSSNGSAEGGSGSGRDTPSSSGNVSLAGGLAEALRARQVAMQGRREGEEEW